MVPELPQDLWMNILTLVSAQQRKDWWNAVTEDKRRIFRLEWPFDDHELAKYKFDEIFTFRSTPQTCGNEDYIQNTRHIFQTTRDPIYIAQTRKP